MMGGAGQGRDRHRAGDLVRRSDRGSKRRLVGVAGRVAAVVVRRPHLWRPAVREVLRLAEPGWWRRAPFLPLPSAGLWAFRMTTAYGDPGAVPSPTDVVSFLEWVDGLDRVVARQRGRAERAPDGAAR